ncbi:hypothetical protein GIB67_004847 [Kingdonia uniflora]|uniref:Uncharacterized protein n=1 Tax=Kingdonia uniflora TaxID=39325 RepID=A0A7J7LNU8_9MAGN|nr:hypothetical protein GIB67_004847 [Kingdonia uniflora]
MTQSSPSSPITVSSNINDNNYIDSQIGSGSGSFQNDGVLSNNDGGVGSGTITSAFYLPSPKPYLHKDKAYGVNFVAPGATALNSSFFETREIKLSSNNNTLDGQIEQFMTYPDTICSSHHGCVKKLKHAVFLVGYFGANDYSNALFQGKHLEEADYYVTPVVKSIKDAVKALADHRVEYSHVQIVYASYYKSFTALLHNHGLLGFEKSSLTKACCGTEGLYNFDATKMCGSEGVPVRGGTRSRLTRAIARDDKERNIVHARKTIEEAAEKGAQLVLLPCSLAYITLFWSGHWTPLKDEEVKRNAESMDILVIKKSHSFSLQARKLYTKHISGEQTQSRKVLDVKASGGMNGFIHPLPEVSQLTQSVFRLKRMMDVPHKQCLILSESDIVRKPLWLTYESRFPPTIRQVE